jgi:hypothetical protein
METMTGQSLREPLSTDEARALGVLIEKATTTPEQYPLTLNSLVAGASQKSNRDPVIEMGEDRCRDALDGLRGKGLVVRIDQAGARVPKYRHEAGQALHARTGELAILAELLLRGPQTLGELRGRASRMHPMETLEDARAMLRGLTDRPEPLACELSPASGSRAERYAQLLCPELHPTTAPATTASAPPPPSPLAERISRLEAEVAVLREELTRLRSALGE